MRGDSLRDFYAKTLAVLGLGLLAGAGAIVDYWPVNEDWPVPTAAAGLRSEPPVLVQDLGREIPAPVQAMHRPRAAAITVAADLFNGIPTDDSTMPDVTLDPMPVPDDFLVVDREVPSPLLMASLQLGPPPLLGGGPDDSRRIFGDAVRRTRDSLAAARVFLGDAFSGVVGAFRRVNPFYSTGVVTPSSF